jgi:V/A-type H+-transporting ATPase subunit I
LLRNQLRPKGSILKFAAQIGCLMMVVDRDRFPIRDWNIALVGAVSCFADINPSIRLFAVGLAGVAIAQTVNGMVQAMPAGVVRIAAGSLLLIFGHSLNLVLGFLSVVVHGIRLNMLEFSGHLGMEWSGVKYTPFSAKVKR